MTEDIEHYINTSLHNLILEATDIKKPKWMTKEETAKYAHVSRVKLEDFIRSGLKVSCVDGVYRISKDDVDAFYSEHIF